jgi:hypothetical protein
LARLIIYEIPLRQQAVNIFQISLGCVFGPMV